MCLRSILYRSLLRLNSKVKRSSTLLAWQGTQAHSEAKLMASAAATQKVELWTWVLAPNEHYSAEPDPIRLARNALCDGGELTLDLAGDIKVLGVRRVDCVFECHRIPIYQPWNCTVKVYS